MNRTLTIDNSRRSDLALISESIEQRMISLGLHPPFLQIDEERKFALTLESAVKSLEQRVDALKQENNQINTEVLEIEDPQLKTIRNETMVNQIERLREKKQALEHYLELLNQFLSKRHSNSKLLENSHNHRITEFHGNNELSILQAGESKVNEEDHSKQVIIDSFNENLQCLIRDLDSLNKIENRARELEDESIYNKKYAKQLKDITHSFDIKKAKLSELQILFKKEKAFSIAIAKKEERLRRLLSLK